MAVPWQADFFACGELWWPAQRPVDVVTDSGRMQPFSRGIQDYADMVRWWSELGFVVKKGDKFVEAERKPIEGVSEICATGSVPTAAEISRAAV